MKASVRQRYFCLIFASAAGFAAGLLSPPPAGAAGLPQLPGNTRTAKDAAHRDGRKAFESRCASCHGLNGQGGEFAPDIITSPNVGSVSDQALLQIIRDGIPRRGMPGFRLLLTRDQLRGVVAFIRGEARAEARAGTRALDGLGTKGNPRRGEALFRGKAACVACHTIKGSGGFLGPDLSGYGRHHAPGGIRQAIVNPNRHPRPGRQVVVARARDGRQWTGVLRNEDNFSLQLLDAEGNFQLLLKSAVADLKREPQSPMPGDYAQRLSAAELEDLVSYLSGER